MKTLTTLSKWILLSSAIIPMHAFGYTCVTTARPKSEVIYTLSIPDASIGQVVQIKRNARGVKAKFIRRLAPAEARYTMPTPKIRNYEGPEITLNLYLSAFNKISGKLSMKDGTEVIENMDVTCLPPSARALNSEVPQPTSEWDQAFQAQPRFAPASY